jgi:hypothetical protein
LTNFEERLAVMWMGTIWSSSPCRMRVGTFRTVTTDETRNLASSRRMSDHDRVLQIELFEKPGEVVCIGP